MIVQCPKCGNLISDKATVCPNCGVSLTPSQDNPKPDTTNIESDIDKEIEKKSESIPEKPTGEGWYQEPEKKKKNLTPIILSIVLSVVILGIGGLFLYKNVLLPNKIDKEAPRYYTFAQSVILRSSKSSGAEFNKICSLPYGTELITYEHGYEWSEVKVCSAGNRDGNDVRGFISSFHIMIKSDFFLLNSIFGDMESKSIIETSKCRRALLNYFKDRNLIGRLSLDETIEYGLPMPTEENQWQVFCLPKDMPTNNIYFKRILRKDSKFTDFAVIIKNINTGARKLLYFTFDEDETPHLAAEYDAPEYGTIKKISLNTKGDEKFLIVDYTE